MSITTGARFSSPIFSAAVTPSVCGIFTSRITTSGRSSRVFSMALSPSPTAAITSKPASVSVSTMSMRMRLSSSATTAVRRGASPAAAVSWASSGSSVKSSVMSPCVSVGAGARVPCTRRRRPVVISGILVQPSTPEGRPGWRNGRRGALKMRCPQGRAGSSPAPGTHGTAPAAIGRGRRRRSGVSPGPDGPPPAGHCSAVTARWRCGRPRCGPTRCRRGRRCGARAGCWSSRGRRGANRPR